MKPQLERQTNIFVVRIWREYLMGEQPELRGEVEDLARHTRKPFSGIHELEDLVRACCLEDQAEEKLASDHIEG